MSGADATTAILDDCDVEAAALKPVLEHLSGFLERYLRRFTRSEQRRHATTVVEGLLSDLDRKSIEPIATRHDQERRRLQHFVGAGGWDDDALLEELRRHVGEDLGEPKAVLVIDGSSFPKRGSESVGVKRQWCGRLGKRENCQVGVYVGYASSKGHTLVDHRLYLPEDWCRDVERRAKCHVPPSVRFNKAWEIGAAMIDAITDELPHAWIAADDEFGRRGMADGRGRRS